MANDKKTSNSGLASKTAAFILISINFLVLVFCIQIFALSLWSIVSSSTLSIFIQAIGGVKLTALFPPESLSINSGVGAATVSIFTGIIAFMGLHGAITRSQFLLFMYSSLVFLLLLLECALLYYFTSNLVEKGLQDDDGQWAHYTRLAFECCDFNTTRFKEVLNPPWSCCGVAFYPQNCTVQYLFSKDCQSSISNWLDHYQIATYALLTVLHIILLSCSLVRRSRSASRSHS